MKSQMAEQRARANQLVSDAQGLLAMRVKAEELELQAQQLRDSYDDACRNYKVVQQKKSSLESEKQKLDEELAKKPLQPYIITS